MKTKFLVKFLNNSAHLDADLEFVDIIQVAVHNSRLNSPGTTHLFDYVEPDKHQKLSTRTNSDHSRKLAANHLKTTIRAAFIKSLYETTTIYFKDILKAATKKGLDIDRLIGEHSINISSKDLIKIGSFEKIIERISSSIFRQLENEKSTKSLIEKMDKKLGLNVGEEIIHAALPYLEIRHRLVHGQGKADKEFCEKYPFIGAVEDKIIELEYTLIDNARKAIITLVKEFDKKIVANGLVETTELQP
jgi:hypothetical protein